MDVTRTLGGVTSLARTVDLRRPSNRFALLAAGVGVVVGVAAALLLGDESVTGALLRGLAYGVATFLAWALGREVDPDDPATARNAVFVYAAAAWTGPPAVAATVALLLAARIVARTTGRSPTRWDLAAVIVVAALAATRPAGFVAALGLAYALFADTRLSEPAPEQTHVLAAVATALVAIGVTLATGAFWTSWRAPGWLEALVLLAAIAAASVLRTETVSSRADLTRQPLHADRLVHARWLLLVTGLVAVLWAGAGAVGALAAAFAAVVAVGATTLARR